MKNKSGWLILTISLNIYGCGPKIVVDGYELNEKWYNSVVQTVTSRAAFDLDCDVSQLKITVLNVGEGEYVDNYPTSIGVTGCNRRAVYVALPGETWVQNGAAETVE